MATIDSGKVEASNKFREVPKSKWKSLVRVKRDFLSVRINYDCRCLIEFCEEAETIWADLGYESAADMIRNGYELEPVEIDLAVAWLKHNAPDEAIGIDAVKAQVAEAKATKDKQQGKRNDLEHLSNGKKLQGGGNGVEYTLRRLARDNPELLDKIEAGELTVNQAAIQAGIRKKPTAEEQCVKAFKKSQSRLVPLKVILEALDPHELVVVMDWIKERLDEEN